MGGVAVRHVLSPRALLCLFNYLYSYEFAVNRVFDISPGVDDVGALLII